MRNIIKYSAIFSGIIILAIFIIVFGTGDEGGKIGNMIYYISLVICGVILLIIPISLLSALVVAAGSGIKNPKEETDGSKPLFFQVPRNYKWILRNVWKSNPKCPESEINIFGIKSQGYIAKKEGYRFWLKGIWHSDEGLVDLTPKQIDIKPFKINCTDMNDILIDTRGTYHVGPNDIDAINFMINTKGVQIDELIRQRISVGANDAIDTDSKSAVEWGTKEKTEFEKIMTDSVNNLLANDGGKNYGLVTNIQIQNIQATEEVQAAADRAKAAEIEEKTAGKEAAALKKKIDETQANPNVVLVADVIAGLIRSLKSGNKQKGE